MKTCITCHPYFTLTIVADTVVCSRINQFTDTDCGNGTYVEPVTFSCFNCNFPNCAKCLSYQNCSQCNQGYFLSNATQNDTNPFNTSQIIIIQIIPECRACMANCINCSSQINCNKCAAKYFYDGGECVLCSGEYCLACNVTSQNCIICIGGTFLNGSKCILCSSLIPNCSNCIIQQNQVTCTDCIYGLYWNGSECLDCGQNCKLCSLIQNSTTSTVYCYECVDNFTINNQTNECISCTKGCIECYLNLSLSSEATCAVCDVGYVIDYNQTTQLFYCKKCSFPCLQCYNDSEACAKCNLGFYMNLLSQDQNGNPLQIGKCYFCSIQNCLSCSYAIVCTHCQDGFFIKPSSENKSQTCSPCLNPCMLCLNKNITNPNVTNQVECTQCLPGYTFLPDNNQTCVSCNNSNCLFCRPQRQKECVQCQPGYKLGFLPEGTVCVSCPLQNCLFCLEDQQTLENGSIVMIDTCGECNTSFYPQQSLTQNYSYCAVCPNNCAFCQNSSYCFNCSDGYYLQQSNPSSCRPCPIQCLTCNSKGCIFCANNYYPASQNISSNPSQQIDCFPCNVIEGCLSCYNQQFCKECTSFMFSVLPGIEGNCLPCPDACLQCDNNQVCVLCDQGYLLINQTNTCLQQTGWPIWAIFIASTLGFTLLWEKAVRRLRNQKRLHGHNESHQNLEKQTQMGEKLRKNQNTQRSIISLDESPLSTREVTQ